MAHPILFHRIRYSQTNGNPIERIAGKEIQLIQISHQNWAFDNPIARIKVFIRTWVQTIRIIITQGSQKTPAAIGSIEFVIVKILMVHVGMVAWIEVILADVHQSLL